MKAQVNRFVAAFVIALLCHVSSAQATPLDDLLGLMPGSHGTKTYGVTESGQPQYPEARQSIASPKPVEPAKPIRFDAQQPIPQTRADLRQVPLSKLSSKEKASSRTATETRLPSVTTLSANQQPNGRVAASYQASNQSQPRSVSRQKTSQQPRSAYSSRVLNYYRGYWNNGWGSAYCPPGGA